MRSIVVSSALAMAMLFPHGTASRDFPAGWRLPTTEEMADPLRRKSPDSFAKATADFNGDGIPDQAFLLKSVASSGEGLWVRLSNAEADFSWLKLHEIKWDQTYPTVGLAMAVEALPPGDYPYICFEDGKDCDVGPPGERQKLKLRDPSLMHFKLDSAASLFFWSRRHTKFMRVWLSD